MHVIRTWTDIPTEPAHLVLHPNHWIPVRDPSRQRGRTGDPAALCGHEGRTYDDPRDVGLSEFAEACEGCRAALEARQGA